ncbi:ODAD1 central coiled coil region domain-containing protein [Plasmodiophora brassicae]
MNHLVPVVEPPVQHELISLQRKLREVEGLRRAHSVNNVHGRDQHLRRLQMENDRLKQDLTLEMIRASQSSSIELALEVRRLQEDYEKFTKQLDVENERIATLRSRIDATREDILNRKRLVCGMNSREERLAEVWRQIRVAEDRLDKTLKRYNETVAHNTELCHMIDMLRRDWNALNGTYQRLQEDIQQKQVEMWNMVDQTESAYRARETAHRKLLDIKHETDEDQARFLKESDQLTRRLEEHRLQMEALTCKDLNPEQLTRIKHSEVGHAAEKDPQEMAKQEIKRLRQSIALITDEITNESQQVLEMSTATNDLQQALQNIKMGTGISDVGVLVQSFAVAEQKNLDLLARVSDLNGTAQVLEEELTVIQDEHALFTKQVEEAGCHQRQRLVEHLEADLARIQTATATSCNEVQSARSSMNTLHGLLGSILERLTGEPQSATADTMAMVSAIEEMVANLLPESPGAASEEPRPEAGAGDEVSVARLPSTQDAGIESEDEEHDLCAPLSLTDLRKTHAAIHDRHTSKPVSIRCRSSLSPTPPPKGPQSSAYVRLGRARTRQ